jgi:hypothetical protein
MAESFACETQHVTPSLSSRPLSDLSLAWLLPAQAMKACTVVMIMCVLVMSSAQQNVTTEESSKYSQRRMRQQPA